MVDKCNYSDLISSQEYSAIIDFLSFYRNKDFIIADIYRQDFDAIPLGNKNITFKSNMDKLKVIYIRKNINVDFNNYLVELALFKTSLGYSDAKNLQIHHFMIDNGEEKHFINLDINDSLKCDILFNIIDIFREDKIISPEQAFGDKILANKEINDYISAKKFKEIQDAINKNLKLLNYLFVMREDFDNNCYVAEFGSILYQLLDYRMNNYHELSSDEKNDLDNLIISLKDNDLLKLILREQISEKIQTVDTFPLESLNIYNHIHSSRINCDSNNGVKEYQKSLKKIIDEKK